MREHICHAINCKTPVPREMFMCKKHWFMLPKDMRDAVWNSYTNGQCDDISKIKQEYFEVTKKAQAFVFKRERTSQGGSEQGVK